MTIQQIPVSAEIKATLAAAGFTGAEEYTPALDKLVQEALDLTGYASFKKAVMNWIDSKGEASERQATLSLQEAEEDDELPPDSWCDDEEIVSRWKRDIQEGRVITETLIVSSIPFSVHLFISDGKLVVAVPSIGCYEHGSSSLPTVYDFIGSGRMDITTAEAVYRWVAHVCKAVNT